MLKNLSNICISLNLISTNEPNYRVIIEINILTDKSIYKSSDPLGLPRTDRHLVDS